MQKFLTDQHVAKQWLQLLAMVCTFVASKVNESHSEKSVTMVRSAYNCSFFFLIGERTLKSDISDSIAQISDFDLRFVYCRDF